MSFSLDFIFYIWLTLSEPVPIHRKALHADNACSDLSESLLLKPVNVFRLDSVN
jgi:hypothetical protein